MGGLSYRRQSSELLIISYDFFQGRAWSLRFEDNKTYIEFLHEMLSKRCSWLSKSWLIFPLSKGTTNAILDGCLAIMTTENEEKEIKIKIGKS